MSPYYGESFTEEDIKDYLKERKKAIRSEKILNLVLYLLIIPTAIWIVLSGLGIIVIK